MSPQKAKTKRRPARRQITGIVIHHSATSKHSDTIRTIASFNRNHVRLTEQGQKPSGHVKYSNIAYHYIIDDEGDVYPVRKHDNIGYHATNWEVNKQSVGICLIGNFMGEFPSKEAMDSLRELIKQLDDDYNISYVKGHKQVSQRSTDCPGTNLFRMLTTHGILR